MTLYDTMTQCDTQNEEVGLCMIIGKFIQSRVIMCHCDTMWHRYQEKGRFGEERVSQIHRSPSKYPGFDLSRVTVFNTCRI